MNNVTKTAAYSSEGGRKRGRPRLHASPAAKQAAYRERKQPARIEPGARVIHRRYGRGIITSIHGDRFIVAFQNANGREWRDLESRDLAFDGRVTKMPAWTDASRPLSKNYKPWRKWKTAIPTTELVTAVDGEKVAVPIYALRSKSGKRRTRRDYTKLINHNLAALVERAYGKDKK